MVAAFGTLLLAMIWFQVDIDGLSGSGWGDARPSVRILNGGGALTRTPAKGSTGATTLTGQVTHVRDGDTIEVASMPIRIANLDCAEKGSAAGDRATRYMRQLVTSERVTCALNGRRSYDRMIGTCSLSDDRDLGQVLIAGGYCAVWR